MKKILALVLAIAMVATFAACGNTNATAEYKIGMGVVVSLDSSADTTAQADATVATVIMDADGKIVAADLDVAQTKVTAADAADLTKVDVRTKKEKGADYGMAAALNYGMDWNGDGVVKEWDAQAAAFAEKMVGKTAADIEAIATKLASDGKHNIADDADLLAVCTMDIVDFKAAFVAACKDADAKTFTAAADSFKLGLAVDTDVSGSTAETAQLYSTFSAVAVDAEGKVLAAIVDAIQPTVAFDKDGKVGEKTYKNTKRGLKDEYGMAAALNYGMDWNSDGVVKEWYVQAKDYTDKMVGKTAADIEGIKTKLASDGNHNICEDADLLAVCTMDVVAFNADMVEAIKAAK